MGRRPRFTEDQLLDAALELLSSRGPRGVTTVAIGRRVGAPAGSLYHRFPSRDALLARLWVRTVDRFQPGWLDHVRRGEAVAAARHVVRWCAGHPREARLLLLHRHHDLLDAAVPVSIRRQVEARRARVARALARYQRAHPGTGRLRLALAVVHLPMGAVRPYLATGRRVPPGLEDLVAEAVTALLNNAPVRATRTSRR